MNATWKIPGDAVSRVTNFVMLEGGAAFTNVVVSGPFPPWPDDTPCQTVDAVWFPEGEPAGTSEWSDSRERYDALLAAGPPVLLNPRGYLDRTGFGVLLAGRELLGRHGEEVLPIRSIALPDKRAPRAERVYSQFGIEIVCGTDEESSEGVRSGRGSWYEDQLTALHYARSCHARGLLLTEVLIRPWRLDGLYFPARSTFELRGWRDSDRDLFEEGEPVEVIEVKRSLDTNVIGQAVAGAARLNHEDFRIGDIATRVVVDGQPDAALEWVCERLGIAVSRYSLDDG